VSGRFELPETRALVAAALAEDLGVPVASLAPGAGGAALLARDVTGSLLPEDAVFSGDVRARSVGVVCGLPVVQHVFAMLAGAAGVDPVEVFPLVAEGAAVSAGEAVLEVRGSARVVLAAERTALDFLMVLSGIATTAARWQAAAGPAMRVVDTRKTLPGLRTLSKYAVRVGGGANQRLALYDGILIKENHIVAAGGIAAALRNAQALAAGVSIQIEIETLDQLREALVGGATSVLLDNFTLAQMRAAVALTDGRALLETSGGVALDQIREIAATGVDRISIGRLTKDVRAIDFSMRVLERLPQFSR
jgi:nicotinate-nucleotide pyrophosphorylase (carboxylating)